MTLFGDQTPPPEPEGEKQRGRWELRTKHHYEFDEVASAFQKAVRRGEEDAALFWAMELNESGYGAYCWRRIFIILSEDVGLADPNAPAHIAGLHYASVVFRESSQYKKKGQPWPEEMLLQAVMYLCKAPKNREANDAYLAIKLRMDRRELLTIPPEAVDQHTKRGRAEGKKGPEGWRFFEEEGRIISPHVQIDGDRWHRRWVEESGIKEGKFRGFRDD